ncbi:MAG: gliding motility-associated C-terminal domain-containing protein [Bacteroidales bacterium]|nr:gliding motility-associated C-terminal domain-containing protein [Bacteroidales bacterium]
MKKGCLPFLFLSVLSGWCIGQNAGFSIPDTICEDKPVIITNVQPASAISYKWSFCTGNATDEPDGINMGNPLQKLNAPRFVTIVQNGSEYYTFTTSSGNSKVIRCFYGNTLTQFPLTTTDLGNFGVLTDQVRGIQVKKDNGTWYGFVANGNKLVRLDFGDSPLNTPVPSVIYLSNAITISGLTLTLQGTEWVGFFTDIAGNSLSRLDFTQGLGNDPLVINLGYTGQGPSSIVLATENNNWYAFICNAGSSTLSRIYFGPSLKNPAPVWTNMPAITGLNQNAGITLINECGSVNGFITNYVIESDKCIVHLNFPKGLGGPVTGYIIENNGILNKPYGISEFVRQGDTLYAFVANYGSSSLTQMFFPSCSSVSTPFYSGPDPPPIIYPDPGNYNIMLTINDGYPDQSSLCKNIEVKPKPTISLGNDRFLCQGRNTVLDAGGGNYLYFWSNGASTRAITVDTTGIYWVHAINSWSCGAFDTIKVTVYSNAQAVVDTTICKGLSYWAQNALRYDNGIYLDTLKMVTGCDSVVTTNLSIRDCPLLIWFPNAFTPNGDGLNDEFRPVGSEIVMYNMQVFNRWGELIFESNDIKTGWNGLIKGREAPPEAYTYIVVFESKHFPGVTHRETGTFTLTR